LRRDRYVRKSRMTDLDIILSILQYKLQNVCLYNPMNALSEVCQLRIIIAATQFLMILCLFSLKKRIQLKIISNKNQPDNDAIFAAKLSSLNARFWRHNTQHNDTQLNGTQQNGP
jgi:hypothetical protein